MLQKTKQTIILKDDLCYFEKYQTMGKHKRESFFWTSYSDLMTSLFFVMLVLFILVIVLLHNKVRATEDELNQIRKLNASVENIDSNFFKYDLQFKRHTLKNIEVSFNTGSSNINDIPLDKQKELINAGKAINKFPFKNYKSSQYRKMGLDIYNKYFK